MFVLNAHKNDPSGLGIVARMAAALGNVVEDAKSAGGKILVPGRPDTHKELVAEGRRNYIWTTFESTQIPQDWVDELNTKYEEVYVPHQSIRTAFKSSGVNVPIQVVHQGYTKYERTRDYEPWDMQNGVLRIGILGVPTQRKNLIHLFSAIEKLSVGYKIDAKLVVHAPWLVTHRQEILQHSPFVELTTGTKTDDEIAEWYSGLHAYIYPSSGEGWSFTPREAMYMGIPTIVSDIDVHRELNDSGFAHPIKSDVWEDAYYEFLNGTCGQWKRYTVDDILQSLLGFVENYGSFVEKMWKQHEWIRGKYVWESAIAKLKSEIEPKHLMFCPTKYQACGINTYTTELLPFLPDTKYISSYDEAHEWIQGGGIQSIHVQHEFGIFNTQELNQHASRWTCKKKITLHNVADDSNTMCTLTQWFDVVFVLNRKSAKCTPKAQYVPHGTSLPIDNDSNLVPKTIGTFGFIHLQKGYQYIVDAAESAGFTTIIVGRLNRKNNRVMELYNSHIKDRASVTHHDGFFHYDQVMGYLKDCSLLVYYYQDDSAIYTSGSILHAARLGIPIITSDSVVFSDFERCVYKVPQNDVKALREAILSVSSDDRMQNMLVDNFRQYLIDNQWSKIARNFQ